MKTPKLISQKLFFLLPFLFSFPLFANESMQITEKTPILADIQFLKDLHIPILQKSEALNLGYAEVEEFQRRLLEYKAHSYGKCGGFEDLSSSHPDFNLNHRLDPKGDIPEISNLFNQIQEHEIKNNLYSQLPYGPMQIEKQLQIEEALHLISEQNLVSAVRWFSSYPNRYNKASDPNRHVIEMQKQLDQMLSTSGLKYEISLIDHNSTRQKSIRVRIPGTEKPQEVVVLGGHFDSIVQWGGDRAPGADDNASGSSNLLEALRILSQYPQPKRTIEFFWYAGEESGLLGSAEIATQYKQKNIQVIAVLQLDMTLFPGAGEMVVGNVEDYTSSWLRSYLVEINNVYELGARFVSDKCGYACSDHASWYRQGYPTLMPFESDTRRMNQNIHTANDTISDRVSFKHSLVFAKIALIFAMDLGNNSLRQPY